MNVLQTFSKLTTNHETQGAMPMWKNLCLFNLVSGSLTNMLNTEYPISLSNIFGFKMLISLKAYSHWATVNSSRYIGLNRITFVKYNELTSHWVFNNINVSYCTSE